MKTYSTSKAHQKSERKNGKKEEFAGTRVRVKAEIVFPVGAYKYLDALDGVQEGDEQEEEKEEEGLSVKSGQMNNPVIDPSPSPNTANVHNISNTPNHSNDSNRTHFPHIEEGSNGGRTEKEKEEEKEEEEFEGEW